MKLNYLIGAAILASGLAVSLPGCQTEMASIPGNAPMVASGTGNTSYTAAHSGTVYIYDKTWNKLVYSGEVNAGQNVKVDANNDKVLVDNQVRVEQIPLGEGSEYEFFLRPDTRMTTVERRTIIEHPRHEIVTEREVR